MNTTKLTALLAIGLLAGCGTSGPPPQDVTSQVTPTTMVQSSSGQIMVTENDVTDKPYRVLGDISVSVPKSSVVDNYVQGKVINALIEKAQALHADAVILVRYQTSGFEFSSMTLGHMDASGRAISFRGAEPSVASAGGGARAPGAPQIPSQTEMKATLKAYVDALDAGNVASVVSLYADDATVEDPLGSPVRHGKKEVEEFVRGGVERGVKYDFNGPIRGSNTNVAAMPVQAHAGPAILDVIEVFTFNPDGKIASMKGIWGTDDRHK